MSRLLFAILTILCFGLFFACSDDDATPTDAGPDAAETDAAEGDATVEPEVDGAVVEAGEPEVDSGEPEVDADVPEPDSGETPGDAASEAATDA